MTNTVKLQGISGQQKGTKTKDLKIGDIIIWNFGYKSEIVEINPSKTGKTITFTDYGVVRRGEIITRSQEAV